MVSSAAPSLLTQQTGRRAGQSSHTRHPPHDMLRRSLQSLAGIGARASIQAQARAAGCVANLPKLYTTGFDEQHRSPNAGDRFQHQRLAAAAAWRGRGDERIARDATARAGFFVTKHLEHRVVFQMLPLPRASARVTFAPGAFPRVARRPQTVSRAFFSLSPAVHLC